MLQASAFYELQATNLGEDFLDIIEEAVNEIAEEPFAENTYTEKLSCN